jgi:myo-inositol-1(or 4)-monophosphatase
VSGARSLAASLLGTGFPFNAPGHIDAYLGSFKDLFSACRDIRRAGAAVLDLSHVAAGRLDGFWELSLKPWDMAAGALIVREAGGVVSDFFGTGGFLEAGNIVAASPALHAEIVERTRRHFTRESVAGLATRFLP